MSQRHIKDKTVMALLRSMLLGCTYSSGKNIKHTSSDLYPYDCHLCGHKIRNNQPNWHSTICYHWFIENVDWFAQEALDLDRHFTISGKSLKFIYNKVYLNLSYGNICSPMSTIHNPVAEHCAFCVRGKALLIRYMSDMRIP